MRQFQLKIFSGLIIFLISCNSKFETINHEKNNNSTAYKLQLTTDLNEPYDWINTASTTVLIEIIEKESGTIITSVNFTYNDFLGWLGSSESGEWITPNLSPWIINLFPFVEYEAKAIWSRGTETISEYIAIIYQTNSDNWSLDLKLNREKKSAQSPVYSPTISNINFFRSNNASPTGKIEIHVPNHIEENKYDKLRLYAKSTTPANCTFNSDTFEFDDSFVISINTNILSNDPCEFEGFLTNDTGHILEFTEIVDTCIVSFETCNNDIDDDCDGLVDLDDSDCPTCLSSEICGDGIDNDCDGYTDNNDYECNSTAWEGCLSSQKQWYWRDKDKDGYASESNNRQACGPSDDYQSSSQGNDCNDNQASVNPGANEICGDGYDTDCDGKYDNSDPECAIYQPVQDFLGSTNTQVSIDSSGISKVGNDLRLGLSFQINLPDSYWYEVFENLDAAVDISIPGLAYPNLNLYGMQNSSISYVNISSANSNIVSYSCVRGSIPIGNIPGFAYSCQITIKNFRCSDTVTAYVSFDGRLVTGDVGINIWQPTKYIFTGARISDYLADCP